MSSHPRAAVCSGHQKGGKCKAPILWGRTEDDKKIPLDLRAVIFEVIGEWPDGTPKLRRSTGHFVTHFSTCCDVDLFKKPKENP